MTTRVSPGRRLNIITCVASNIFLAFSILQRCFVKKTSIKSAQPLRQRQGRAIPQRCFVQEKKNQSSIKFKSAQNFEAETGALLAVESAQRSRQRQAAMVSIGNDMEGSRRLMGSGAGRLSATESWWGLERRPGRQ